MLRFLVLALFPHFALPTASSSDVRATGGDMNACNNQRSLFSIVWGCFTTIFACIWVSAHPNVPPPVPRPPKKDATVIAHLKWYLIDSTIGVRRRLKLVLVAFIAPELIVGFAGRQLETAWYFSREFNLSLTHGFFISMGGFVDSEKHPIVDTIQVMRHLYHIRQVSEQDIFNRSQGDAFSKGIALLQALWFVLQGLARLQQHLTLTELEVATLGFAAVNAFGWLLWWKKPLDVRAPIVLPPLEEDVGIYAGDPGRGREPERSDTGEKRPLRERFSALFGVSDVRRDYHHAEAVPTFHFATGSDDHERYTPSISLLVALIFSAVHCAAWRTHFLSAAEMWLWRAASLVLGIAPAVALSVHQCATVNPDSDRLGVLLVIRLYIIGALLYVPARIILVILPLMALRDVPGTAYLEVNWNRYLPHV
ncbi:hypothetical protein MIND_00797900 [Mycena indigotica]|uniref:Uncharacterized protein n=1 Tax=Mycena indigotica TaxID=2126181 RepID=A0A8H6W7P4_9AGAR|nr:uncharacterized protein MIND_00797900 [Mycena indigotica]KAF7302304.1 hypothetical protein MIND_00797900 [Mycena indigotica]